MTAILNDKRKIRGRLSEILWQGRQWAVTTYGIECRDGSYRIEADRLGEHRLGSSLPDWPLHMMEKNWLDPEDFLTAFLVALPLHGHGDAFSAAELRQVTHRALRERAGRQNHGSPTAGGLVGGFSLIGSET